MMRGLASLRAAVAVPGFVLIGFGALAALFAGWRAVVAAAHYRASLAVLNDPSIRELEGDENKNIEAYANPETPEYAAMIENIRKRLHLTSLKYQKLPDLVEAIGLPKEKLCTYCWDGCEGCK